MIALIRSAPGRGTGVAPQLWTADWLCPRRGCGPGNPGATLRTPPRRKRVQGMQDSKLRGMSAVDLVGRLIDDVSELVEKQIELGRVEGRENLFRTISG